MPETDEEPQWWAEHEESFDRSPEVLREKAQRDARIAVARAAAAAASDAAADLRRTADAAEDVAEILTDIGTDDGQLSAARDEAAVAAAGAEAAEASARDLRREAEDAADVPDPQARHDEASWLAYFQHFYGVDAPLNARYEANSAWVEACAPPDVYGQRAEYMEANDPGRYVDFEELWAERMGITPDELKARERADEAEAEVRHAERKEHGNEEDLLAARLELGAATAALHAAVAAREAAYARRRADAGRERYTDADAQAAEKRAAAEQDRAGKAQRAADEWNETLTARRGGSRVPEEPAARRPYSRRAERLQHSTQAALDRFTAAAERAVRFAAAGDADPDRQQELDMYAAVSARLFLDSYGAAANGPSGDMSLQKISRFAAARLEDGHHAAVSSLPGESQAAALSDALFRYVIGAGDLSTAVDRIQDPAAYARNAGLQADAEEARGAARPAPLGETATAPPAADGVSASAVKPAVSPPARRVHGVKAVLGRR